MRCRKEYFKAYRKKNKDKIAKQRVLKAYYEKNKDKMVKQNKAYREKNKDKIAEQSKAYREKKNEKYVKIPTEKGIEKVYANGFAQDIQKQVPELIDKVRIKLLNEIN